jgi:hypothetical protein
MTENPAERAAFSNGYDQARSEARAAANKVIRQISDISLNMQVLSEQIAALQVSVFDLAFPDRPDGATNVDQDRK